VGVKEEEQLVDSSDIFSHISGVNSFKCNYPIQSWIWVGLLTWSYDLQK